MLEIKAAKNPLVTDSKKQLLLPHEPLADAYRKKLTKEIAGYNSNFTEADASPDIVALFYLVTHTAIIP